MSADTAVSVARAPKEQYIEELFPSARSGYTVRITATVEKKNGFRAGNLRQFRSVGKQRTLRFTACTDVPGPFDLYWKIRNSGAEAAGTLRGELIEDTGSLSRTETTQYRGRHYVEAYVVKDGQVLARDRHDVVIEEARRLRRQLPVPPRPLAPQSAQRRPATSSQSSSGCAA